MNDLCGSRGRVAACAVSVLAGALLAACGGGGGGGSNGGGNNPPPTGGLPYTGITTAAALNASNTPTISGALLYELGIASGDRPVPVQLGGGTLKIPSASNAMGKVRTAKSAKSLKPVDTQNCSGGGTVRIDDQTNANGTGNVSLTYSACVEGGLRTDGVLRLQIAAYDLVQDEPTDFTATFDGYAQSQGSFGLDIDGNVHSVVTSVALTTTYDIVTRYRPENVQHRMQNVVVRETALSANANAVTVTGRFFHSAHGYVDVETREPLAVNLQTGIAGAGVLRLHSSAATLADVRFTSADQIVLSLDENGDGTVDRELSATGLAGLRATNHLPSANAGPDKTVSEGSSVTLSGSGSDWDGNALTYQWWCEASPAGGHFVIGAQAQTAFQPPTPGTYLIHLRVTDGQPQQAIDAMTLTVTDNAAPVANAGADVETVDHESVLLDAGASTDTENDPLHYTWTLLTSPASGAAPASAEGSTFSFAPGAPGNYTYRLTVADAFGSSQDEVRIVVNRLIGFGFGGAIVIDPTTPPQFLTQTVPINVSHIYSGPPVPLTVTTDVPWLDIVSAATQTGPNATVVVTIDTAELQSMANGTHIGKLTVTPTGHTTHSSELALIVALPRIEHVAPYVTYVGQPSPVTFYGDRLDQLLGATLVINGIDLQGFVQPMADRATITLPALPAGEYTMHVKNNLGLVIPMSRFVVRAPPTYPDADFAIGGRIGALEYDSERDAFYAITFDSDSVTPFTAVRFRFDGVQWHSDAIAASEPQSVALNADGTTLFVTSANCVVHEVDPVTLAVLHTATRPGCFMDHFGIAMGLADSRMLIGDTRMGLVYEYPGFAMSSINFPFIHNPDYHVTRSREHLLWVETPTVSPPRKLYSYDLQTDTFLQIAVPDPDAYMIAGNVAISGDGHRVMHRNDLYEDGQYIGSLQGSFVSSFVCPALTTSGERAVVLNPDTDVLALFDLHGGPSFAKIADIATLPDDVGFQSRVALLPDDSVAFVFTSTLSPPPTEQLTYKLYVRNLP